MARLLPVLFALLFLTACASSADTARDDDRVAQTLASMDDALDLTDAQAERIREILVAQEANRPSGPPPRGGQGGQGGDVDPRALMEAVLTETQVAAYREWRASQPQPPQGGRPHRQ